MTTIQIICVAAVVVMMVLYVIQPIPMSMTAMIISIVLCLTGCLEPTQMLSNFSNASAVLVVSFFIIGAGFRRTQLVHHISQLLYKISKGDFKKMLMSYCLVTYLLTQFVSNSSIAAAVVLPLCAGMCVDMGIDTARAIYPLGLLTIATIGSWPIGNALTHAATYNGYLEQYEYTNYSFDVLDMPLMMLPLGVLVLLFCLFVFPKIAPEKGENVADISGAKEMKEAPPLDPVREVIGYGVFFVASLALVFQKHIPWIPTWQIALVGAVVIVTSGVLTRREAQAAMPMQLYLIYVGSLCVGNALVGTGVGDLIGNAIIGLIGSHPNNFMMGFLFYFLSYFMTQFMMNMSVPGILNPICIITCKALGCNPVGPLIVIFLGCVSSFMLPSATVAVPMVMSYGGYSTKQLAKLGIIPSILITLYATFVVMSVHPIW